MAAKVIFCLDHTKFGRRSVTPLYDLEPIDIIVTDSPAPTELVEQLRAKGIEWLWPPTITLKSPKHALNSG
jgi:DeoR/GlpR family transcriptional regulator of sugar metabolism